MVWKLLACARVSGLEKDMYVKQFSLDTAMDVVLKHYIEFSSAIPVKPQKPLKDGKPFKCVPSRRTCIVFVLPVKTGNNYGKVTKSMSHVESSLGPSVHPSHAFVQKLLVRF